MDDAPPPTNSLAAALQKAKLKKAAVAPAEDRPAPVAAAPLAAVKQDAGARRGVKGPGGGGGRKGNEVITLRSVR